MPQQAAPDDDHEHEFEDVGCATWYASVAAPCPHLSPPPLLAGESGVEALPHVSVVGVADPSDTLIRPVPTSPREAGAPIVGNLLVTSYRLLLQAERAPASPVLCIPVGSISHFTVRAKAGNQLRRHRRRLRPYLDKLHGGRGDGGQCYILDVLLRNGGVVLLAAWGVRSAADRHHLIHFLGALAAPKMPLALTQPRPRPPRHPGASCTRTYNLPPGVVHAAPAAADADEWRPPTQVLYHPRFRTLVDYVRMGVAVPPDLSLWAEVEAAAPALYAKLKHMLAQQDVRAEESKWRITEANANFALCETYPEYLAVPAAATDATLRESATFRDKRRIPVLSYLDYRTGASITRCAQPLSGVLRVNRNIGDEELIRCIRKSAWGAACNAARETPPQENHDDTPLPSASFTSGTSAAANAPLSSLRQESSGVIVDLSSKNDYVTAQCTPQTAASATQCSSGGGFGGYWAWNALPIGRGASTADQKPPRQVPAGPPPALSEPLSRKDSLPDMDEAPVAGRDRSLSPLREFGVSSGGVLLGSSSRCYSPTQRRGRTAIPAKKPARSASAAGAGDGGASSSDENTALSFHPLSKITTTGSKKQGADEEEGQPGLYIMDLRPYKNVIGNQLAKGGGHESSHYAPAKIMFCGIHNIHAVMDSMLKLQDVAKSQNEDIVEGLRDDSDAASDSDENEAGPKPGHLIARVGKDERKLNAGQCNGVEETRWLQHIRSILAASLEVVSLVTDHRASVLIHCSDGWDRTPQVTSLSQLILDPHARTLEGLAGLVEKEWVAYGHSFSTRCSGLKLTTPFGHTNLACQDIDPDGSGGGDKRWHQGICGEPHPSQQSPTFVQWLACVKQLLDQHPAAFEYRPAVLWVLADAAVSGKHAAFLANSDYERYQLEGFFDFPCPWAALLGEHRDEILNPTYDPAYSPGVLPAVDVSMGKLDPWLLPRAGRQTHAERLKQREVEAAQANLERSRREMESERREVDAQKAALESEREELERLRRLQNQEVARLQATTASQRDELARLVSKMQTLEARYTEDVGHRPVEVREVHPGGRAALKCPILDKEEVVAAIQEKEDPMQDEDDSIVLVLHMSDMQKNDAAARKAGGSSPEVVGAPNLPFLGAARGALPPALNPKKKDSMKAAEDGAPKSGVLVTGESLNNVDVHDNWFSRA
eukprot:TRINITY_DN29820_c0_g1_i1.p1 TRINITY_DN29820_c0_g1~~TRINITY_DN29820_c0_g1_i1.p1  ORF type:complete len:1170 (+),score=303.26 TRINITY_DN29820_c0_g1_i1:100-3609(+)